jgi:hypothetical protein
MNTRCWNQAVDLFVGPIGLHLEIEGQPFVFAYMLWIGICAARLRVGLGLLRVFVHPSHAFLLNAGVLPQTFRARTSCAVRWH